MRNLQDDSEGNDLVLAGLASALERSAVQDEEASNSRACSLPPPINKQINVPCSSPPRRNTLQFAGK